MDKTQYGVQAVKAVLPFLLLLGCLSHLPSPSQSISIDVRERGEARWRNYPTPCMVSSGDLLLRRTNANREAHECWMHFRRIPGCTHQLIQSASSGNRLKLGYECCVAVLNLSPRCFYKVLFTCPFNPEFGPMAKNYCMMQLAK